MHAKAHIHTCITAHMCMRVNAIVHKFSLRKNYLTEKMSTELYYKFIINTFIYNRTHGKGIIINFEILLKYT